MGASGIYLDEYGVPFDDLRQHLMDLVVAQNKQLFLRADKEVAYGVVVKVMGEIKSVGIEKLGVVAESGEPNAPTPVPRQTAQHTSLYLRGAIPK